LVGKILENDKVLSEFIHVHYPTLESHPDYKLAQKYNSTGGILTFTFNNPVLNQRDLLNKFIYTALSISKKRGVSLTKGLSFGFSLPRIFASSARPENNNALPYLRLSVGDRSYYETKLLADILLEAFKIHINDTLIIN
jgi:cystathionine gamma-synthase